MPTKPERDKEHVKNRVIQVLIWFMAVSMITIGGGALYLITRPPKFQPLTYSTVKIMRVDPSGAVVIPQVEGNAAPSILASDRVVPFAMEQCSSHDETFRARFKTWFVDLETGDRFQFSAGGTEIDITPGCESPRFELGLSRELLYHINSRGLALNTPTRWRVEGEGLPTDQDNAVPSYWETETFLIISDRPTLEATE